MLYGDSRVAQATHLIALNRSDVAKPAEVRDVSTFQVLDPPTLPTRRARPRGSSSVAQAMLLGLITSLAFEWWGTQRKTAADLPPRG
jgi:LPS O-antigen subunit length determinant protein (WzzB/FepE family)